MSKGMIWQQAASSNCSAIFSLVTAFISARCIHFTGKHYTVTFAAHWNAYFRSHARLQIEWQCLPAKWAFCPYNFPIFSLTQQATSDFDTLVHIFICCIVMSLKLYKDRQYVKQKQRLLGRGFWYTVYDMVVLLLCKNNTLNI